MDADLLPSRSLRGGGSRVLGFSCITRGRSMVRSKFETLCKVEESYRCRRRQANACKHDCAALCLARSIGDQLQNSKASDDGLEGDKVRSHWPTS